MSGPFDSFGQLILAQGKFSLKETEIGYFFKFFLADKDKILNENGPFIKLFDASVSHYKLNNMTLY